MGNLVRKVLPLVGAAVGGYFGGPAGASAGASLGTAASSALTPAPKITIPKVIPVPDEEALKRTQRRLSRTGGRAGTFLSDSIGDVTGSAGPAGADRLGP